MIRRQKPRAVQNGQAKFVRQKRESSRLAPVVISNPVYEAADWSQESYFLEDLLTQHPLPQVVKCSSRLVPGEEQNIPINVHVPMLLYDGRTARKLLAKHVGTDVRNNVLLETNDSIVIPGDYDGNFLRLQARTTQDKSVARTLNHIATSDSPAFVNFSPIISFATESRRNNNADVSQATITEGSSHSLISGGSTSHQSSKGSKLIERGGLVMSRSRYIHPPGSVFVVIGTTRGKAESKNGGRSRDVLLIRCSDEKGNHVVIPSDQPAEVVEVEVPNSGSSKLSVLPEDLMASKRYPGLVRYVYGDHPPRLTPCSSMFTLIDTFEESSVIGCLLYPSHAFMIELPLTSSLTFQVALNKDEVMELPVPRHALAVVGERRETFIRDLKLKCKFLHRVSQGLAQHAEESGLEDDLPSATVRTRQTVNEAFFYL